MKSYGGCRRKVYDETERLAKDRDTSQLKFVRNMLDRRLKDTHENNGDKQIKR